MTQWHSFNGHFPGQPG